MMKQFHRTHALSTCRYVVTKTPSIIKWLTRFYICYFLISWSWDKHTVVRTGRKLNHGEGKTIVSYND